MPLTARLLGATALITAGAALVYVNLPTAGAQVAAVSEPVDMTRLLAFLPEEMVTKYDEVAFDDATGMTRITGLRFSSEEEADIGVQIGELQIAGLDMDMLEARAAGEQLDGSGLLIDHFQASDITLFGVEALYGGALAAYSNVLDDAVGDLAELDEELAEGALSQSDVSFEKLDFQIDEILIDDFILRPFELSLKAFEEDDEDAEVFGFLQTAAAYYRAMGAGSMSLTGLNFEMDMSENGQPMSMTYAVPSVLVEGWSGGDLERSVTASTKFNMSVPVDEDDGQSLPFETMEMSGNYGRQTVEGIRLDKALGWLARGQMPPRTETDLMSLGTWTSESLTFNMFGEEFYSMGAASMDMTGFHWLIPTKIDLQVDDLVYNIGPFFETIAKADPDIAEGEELQTMLAVLEVMEKYDLAAPSVDADMTWRWDAEGGPAEFAMKYGLDGYGTAATDFAMISASFDEFADLFDIEDEEEREAAFEDLARRKMKFSGFSLELDDDGGLANLFAMAVDIMQVAPNKQTAGFANMDPDGLRAMVAGLLPLASLEASKVFPPAAEYVNAFSSYLTEGGTFRVAAQPASPLTTKEIEKLPELIDDADQIVALLGLTVEHTPEAN